MSPKFRQALYYVGTILSALVGLALIYGGLDAGAADSIGQIVSGVLAMLGATAPAVAAAKVSEQRKDGTLQPTSPAEQAINGVQAVIMARDTAQAEYDKVQHVVSTTIVNQVPTLGPLATQILSQGQGRTSDILRES